MSHRARKRFGQNFLQDHNIIYDIVSNLQVQSDENWVEIGPGLGALTESLLHKDINLHVIELDRDLITILKNKFEQHINLTIHNADALDFNFATLAKQNNKLRIIGNLPYNISTPLLFHLLEYASCIEDMHFMLQKEVVDRICAAPGNKKYGRLSVMIQYFCATELLFEVPPESFDPAPKVMSSMLRLIPHRTPPVKIISIELLNKVVKTAFSQRRKTIRNSLKSLVSEQQIRSINIDPGCRAESLSLADFAQLSRIIDKTEE